MSRKVVCVNTGEVFDCISDAARWANISIGSQTDISKCCRGKKKHRGRHPVTGEKLAWKYYEEAV